MSRPIDAESPLDHARRKPLKYSDEQTRQTAWWFILDNSPRLKPGDSRLNDHCLQEQV